MKIPSKWFLVRIVRRVYLRIKVACKIVFKQKCGVVIYLSEQELISLVTKNDLTGEEVKISYYGCMEHQALKAIKSVGDMIDDIEIICNKAEFDVFVEDNINKLPK